MAQSVGGVWPADRSCHINALQTDMMDGLLCVLFIFRPPLCYEHVLVRKWPMERFSPWQLSFSWCVPILSSDVVSRCGPYQNRIMSSGSCGWSPIAHCPPVVSLESTWQSIVGGGCACRKLFYALPLPHLICPLLVRIRLEQSVWWPHIPKCMAGVTHLMMLSLWQ